MTLDAETGLALALSRKFVEPHGGGPDLGHEPGGRGLEVYVHDSGASGRVAPTPRYAHRSPPPNRLPPS